jgi:hypothetical protein
MDVRCPRCGEPWDFDTLHDATSEAEYRVPFYRDDADRRAYRVNPDYDKGAYAEAVRTVQGDFRARGCIAITERLVGPTAKACEPNGTLAAAASSALMDIMGDDFDGVASELEDAEAAGLI